MTLDTKQDRLGLRPEVQPLPLLGAASPLFSTRTVKTQPHLATRAFVESSVPYSRRRCERLAWPTQAHGHPLVLRALPRRPPDRVAGVRGGHRPRPGDLRHQLRRHRSAPADRQHPRRYLDPTWSPDGRRIVFTSRRDRNFEIYVMNADGSDQTNISRSPAWDEAPAWQPAD